MTPGVEGTDRERRQLPVRRGDDHEVDVVAGEHRFGARGDVGTGALRGERVGAGDVDVEHRDEACTLGERVDALAADQAAPHYGDADGVQARSSRSTSS